MAVSGRSEQPDHTAALAADPQGLREDLSREYYAILEVVSAFDQRFLTVKGWSVTLSLAALGLGFTQEHAAYFALAAFSGLCFWGARGGDQEPSAALLRADA